MKTFNPADYRFLFFYISLIFYYLFVPFFLIKTGHFFSLIQPAISNPDYENSFLITIKLVNIDLLFFFLIIVSIFLYFFLKLFCSSPKKKVSDKILYFFYTILIFCTIVLLLDIIVLFYKILNKEIIFTRDNIYVNYLYNKKTTSILIGSITALYLFVIKKNILSIFFFFLLSVFTFSTFSRFELLLLLISFFLFIERKKIKYFLILLIVFVFYRMLFNFFYTDTSLVSVFKTFLWEPCSLWINAINLFQIFEYNLNKEKYFFELFLNNFSIETLSNSRYEQIFFSKNFFTISTARLGFLEFIGYPILVTILGITAYMQKKIISYFLSLENLYYILSVYLVFFSLRGSIINGFLFVNKFLLIILVLIFFNESRKVIKKLLIKIF